MNFSEKFIFPCILKVLNFFRKVELRENSNLVKELGY